MPLQLTYYWMQSGVAAELDTLNHLVGNGKDRSFKVWENCCCDIQRSVEGPKI